jgi:hypothetical protein
MPAPQGKAHVLAVGIDGYDRDAGFAPRTTGAAAASALADCFLDVFQLNAAGPDVRVLSSRTSPVPSRGEILKALRRLAAAAGPADRIVFFFSGHLHTLDGQSDQRYLVPEDAYSDHDADALISLAQVRRLLDESPARHKLVFLEGDELAGGRLSHHLVLALRGTVPAALDRQRLTRGSLRAYLLAQLPGGDGGHAGADPHESADDVELADFSGSALNLDRAGAASGLAAAMTFSTAAAVEVKDFLSDLKGWNHSERHIEGRVNAALATRCQGDLGKLAARLRRGFGWPASAVAVEGAQLVFPDGHHARAYRAQGTKRGQLIQSVTLAPAWFGRPDDMVTVLEQVGFVPEEMSLDLRTRLEPETAVAGLEAKGWSIDSQLSTRIEANRAGLILAIEPMRIGLSGVPTGRRAAPGGERERLALLVGALESLRRELG